MPRGGPNLGKIASVIPAVLPHDRLLFVQRDLPMPNQQGAFWSSSAMAPEIPFDVT